MMKNVHKKLFVFYAAVFIIGYFLFNRTQYHIQFVDSYRFAASKLVTCIPTACPAGVLHNGIIYYEHTVPLIASVNALNAIGYCYYYLKQYGQALEYFQKACKYSPHHFSYRFNLAVTYARLNRHAQAREQMSIALDKINDINNFFNPDIIFSDVNKPREILDNKDLRVTYEWYHAKKQAVDFISSMEGDKGIDLNNLSLYYYVPIFSININGKQTKVF